MNKSNAVSCTEAYVQTFIVPKGIQYIQSVIADHDEFIGRGGIEFCPLSKLPVLKEHVDEIVAALYEKYHAGHKGPPHSYFDSVPDAIARECYKVLYQDALSLLSAMIEGQNRKKEQKQKEIVIHEPAPVISITAGTSSRTKQAYKTDKRRERRLARIAKKYGYAYAH